MKRERLQVSIVGAVQGVGFRPFVFRLCEELGLAGWVRNDGDGVTIEAEGTHDALLALFERVQREAPRAAVLYAVDARWLDPVGETSFEIVRSRETGPPRVWVLPDLAACPACLADVRDPGDRRYRYPFTNCTHCGPRFTILDALPYDRPNTAMRSFALCADCAREYADPDDRRFHAQPTACPRCGPRVRVGDGSIDGDPALRAAVGALRDGSIVAVKGLGGYHLMVDAADERAVARLRERKRRSGKPFAVMYPDLAALRRHVDVPSFAEPLLTGTQAPILLLPRSEAGTLEIAESVAPGSPYLGVFLPYTPLHELILDGVGRPVVATSGNVSDEPIVTDDDVAASVLGSIADVVLSHDRPIRRPADDSVAHVVTRPRPRPQLLRRARGYAPLPILVPRAIPPMLSLGGQMNVTFAFSRDREIVLSQHFGDLDGYEARRTYRRGLDDLLRLYDVGPEVVVHDLHPDYVTTGIAAEMSGAPVAVQHHHAHLAACLLENDPDGRALGVTWDGTGYGDDRTVWGGEFLAGDAATSRRVATLVPFRLPGGEAAVREPWRTALALLDVAYDGSPPEGLAPFAAADARSVALVRQMASGGTRAPRTTSAGRLFDGMSAILGLSMRNTHQAESAQRLEFAAWRHGPDADPLPLPVVDGDGPLRLDWRETVREAVDALRTGATVETIAARFHHALARAIVEVARTVGERCVALTGGVFCNRYLTECAAVLLEDAGFVVRTHALLPPTDGSLAAGQLWAAFRRIERG